MKDWEQQQTIGIIGGGQLGRMLTLAALPLGFKVLVLNPTPNGPAKQAGAEEIVADLYDPAALRTLVERSDFVTIEIEHLNADALEALTDLNTPINPAPQTIKLIQDKYQQKLFLQEAGVAVAPFAKTDIITEAEGVFKEFSTKSDGKMLLKTRHGAYDGRGNMVVSNTADIAEAFKRFGDTPLYAEQFIPFVKELAVMVARDMDGSVALYPVTETIHARNICLETLTPAPIETDAETAATALAQQVASLLQGAGMFGIEMFLTADRQVLVNEIAPRVHNSGHYTMNACRTS